MAETIRNGIELCNAVTLSASEATLVIESGGIDALIEVRCLMMTRCGVPREPRLLYIAAACRTGAIPRSSRTVRAPTSLARRCEP